MSTITVIALCLLWSCLACLLWTYAGYPLSIGLLARLYPREERSEEPQEWPKVSVVMAVHNESGRVVEKLKNLKDLRYPEGALEWIVVDDGSRDDTWELLAADPDIRAFRQREPLGKPAALNLGVSKARGQYVLFCDARQRLEPEALEHLVRRMQDPHIGAVSGELVMESAKGPGMYWRYERAIREAEGRFDSTVGATGALYLIRRSLFQPIPKATLLDDMYLPLCIALLGYRVVFEPKARVWDVESPLCREFQRKARTLAGNFQLLEQLPDLLNPRRNRLFGQLLFHKLMRLLCPYALVGVALSSAWLAAGSGLFLGLVGLQILCYGSALFARLSQGRGGPFCRLCHTFIVLNLAAMAGFLRYLRRDFAWTR